MVSVLICNVVSIDITHIERNSSGLLITFKSYEAGLIPKCSRSTDYIPVDSFISSPKGEAALKYGCPILKDSKGEHTSWYQPDRIQTPALPFNRL